MAYVLITSHGAAMKNTNRRDRDGNSMEKATSMIDYNQTIGGIDQQLDSFDVPRQSFIWYHNSFLGLIIQYALTAHK